MDELIRGFRLRRSNSPSDHRHGRAGGHADGSFSGRDDAHERRVQRYLAVLRQLGLVVALVFTFGFVAGSKWPLFDETNSGFATLVVGFYAIYFLFDRLMRVTLASRYRPEGEAEERGEQRKSRSATERTVHIVVVSTAVIAVFAVSLYLLG